MKLSLPARPSHGHKGTFGSLGVIGGQINKDTVMLGSAVFAAKAAIRSGVGLVYFFGEKQVLIELVKMLPQAVGQNSDQLKKVDAVVIGPGLGQTEKSILALKKVLRRDLPTVIDADGLNILAAKPELIRLIHDKCVLTPHPGEFEHLGGALQAKNAKQLADKLGCCVVLKGSQTMVTNGQKKWLNDSANPALATGGTGDVLAGLIGSLLAQYSSRLPIFDCACLGVRIHSQAGLAWQKRHGSSGLIIDELIDLIPKTMEEMRKIK